MHVQYTDKEIFKCYSGKLRFLDFLGVVCLNIRL